MTQYAHVTHVPSWYRAENVVKHDDDSLTEQTTLNKIQPLPRLSLHTLDVDEYGEFELELLDKASSYGFDIPYIKKNLVDFAELGYLIDEYEALDEEGKFFVQQANNYHIPIKAYHLRDIITLSFEIEDYASLLNRANELRIDWDTSTYDSKGLEIAILEATLESEAECCHYRNSLIQDYKSMRGL